MTDAGNLLPNGKQQFFDADGNPLSAGSVGFYIPSTLTPKGTWSDPGLTIPNANPVPLDSGGWAIIYGAGDYRQIVKDALGNTIWDQLTSATPGPFPSWGGNGSGTANAQACAASSFALQDGSQIAYRATLANTGAMTLAVGAFPAKPCLVDSASGPIPFSGGEIRPGTIPIFTYDLSLDSFHLSAGSALAEAFGPATSIVGAATVDLGTATGHLANITGSAWTITSFGSSGSANFPLYLVTFAGSGSITNSASLLTPSGAPFAISGGDSLWALYQGGGVWRVLEVMRAGAPEFLALGAVRFARSGGTTAKLSPFGGNGVTFPSGVTALVPGAGITTDITNCYLDGLSAKALTASTLYYAYLWNAGSAAVPNWVIDWSTTGHATDATSGIEIKSGDATRVLVGMAYPQAGPVLTDSVTARLVASWFNRQSKPMANNFTTGRSTSATTFVEINSEIRCLFVCWGDAISVGYQGDVTQSAGSANMPFVSGVGIDGAGASVATRASIASSAVLANAAVWGTIAPAEGFHYATVMGFVGGGNTGTWDPGGVSQLDVQLVI